MPISSCLINYRQRPMQVTLFRDFLEDHRISMELYADDLGQALHARFQDRCQVHQFRPRLPTWLGTDAWSMRLARYAAYPWQAHWQQGQINHVLDHGYGHLLYVLDPEHTIVTVHDLIPLVRWRGGIPGVSPGPKPWLSLMSFHALRHARHLIAISENTRRDLIRFCGCKPEDITVIYYGVDEMFRVYSPTEKAAARHKWNLPVNGTSRVMICGSQFYKNQTGALRAFAQLRTSSGFSMELLKVGPSNAEWARVVQELGLARVTKCLGVVSPHEMPEIYNCVELLLFPSFYEGFGRPPLEAMACGTPVVTSNAGSLPEVVGDAAIVVNPHDHEALAQAMYHVFTNDELRSSLIERGLAWTRQFAWEKTAQKTLEVYEGIIRR